MERLCHKLTEQNTDAFTMIVAHSWNAVYMGEILFGVVVYTPNLIDHDDG